MSHTDHMRRAGDIVVRCAIITCSDTRTPETDTSGDTLRKLLEAAGHQIVSRVLIPDDPVAIAKELDLACAQSDAVLFNGGTGISKRDGTVDLLEKRLEKTLPGFGELFRMLSYDEVGPAAMLSRAVAGTYHDSIVFAMPGSTAAVRLATEKLIVPQLEHLVRELRR